MQHNTNVTPIGASGEANDSSSKIVAHCTHQISEWMVVEVELAACHGYYAQAAYFNSSIDA